MEGTNNKIKTQTRQAYGYRDQDFFILTPKGWQGLERRGEPAWNREVIARSVLSIRC